MTALVELLREPLGGSHRVTRLPPWVRSPRGEYWHQPRSAAFYPELEVTGAGDVVETGRHRLAVQSWCGVGLGSLRAGEPQFASEAPEDLQCGTCVGRRLGWLREQGLVFRPRDHFDLPRWCPGDEYGPDRRRCAACGAKVNAARGWWASGMAAHPPAPELAERCRPCPRHGWKDVRTRDGRLHCWTFVGGEGYCGVDCGPFGA